MSIDTGGGDMASDPHPAKVSAENIDWGEEVSGPPEGAFPHVEHSLDNGVRAGMIVEVPLFDDRFWLARVDAVFGPLVKLTMVPDGPCRHLDLGSRRIFPLGYCQMNKKTLQPPQAEAVCPNWKQLAIQYLEDPSCDTVPMHFMDAESGITPVERIQPGQVIDVRRNEGHGLPDRFWPAVIKANHGGLLQLQNLGLEDDNSKFVLFYRSPRVRATPTALGRGKEPHILMKDYSPPTPDLKDYDLSKGLGERERPPSEVLAPAAFNTPRGLRCGQVGEIVDPKTLDHIVPVFIRSIGANGWLLVVHGNGDESVVHVTDLLPSGFAASNGIPIDLSKKQVEGPTAVIKPHIEMAADKGFSVGQRLEFVREVAGGGHFEIHTATISATKCQLLVLRPDGERDSEMIVRFDSAAIFPLGWAYTNSLKVMVPPALLLQQPSSPKSDSKAVEEKEPLIQLEEGGGNWCPPIYFNYKCYSSSFLSKARLACLPQQVGPGSVRLVMSAVMNYLVGSSFKSQSVLKRLEIKTERPREDYVVEELKGKSRVLHLKAKVEIPTKARQIDKFLKEVCAKVYACPNLVSTERYSDLDSCPTDCWNRPKTEFKDEEEEMQQQQQAATAAAAQVGRKGKRRKRRNPDKLLLEEAVRRGLEGGDPHRQLCSPADRDSSGDDGDVDSSATGSRNVSRSSSPDPAAAAAATSTAKRQRREVVKSEMKTRGAKLPDFKLWSEFGSVVRDISKAAAASCDSSASASEGSPAGGAKGQGHLYSYHDRHVMIPVCVNAGPAGSKRTTRRLELPPAFSVSDLPVVVDTPPDTSPDEEASDHEDPPPPPIRRIRLAVNPEDWTVADTMKFLAQTSDCAHLAHFMLQDEIDGEAFMMLNYPTVKDYWKLKTSTAIRLCQHIESVRLAHMTQFS